VDGPVRRGGRVDLPNGERVVWSVADGRRGRRWRELAQRDGVVTRSILFETAPHGRVVRLEIATAAGLLTVHPDGDGEVLHGNVVGAEGVRHLTFDRASLLVVGSPTAAAIETARLAGTIGVGESRPVDLVRLDDRLDPRPETWEVARLADRHWRLSAPRRPVGEGGGGPTEDREIRLDEHGLVLIPGAVWWPLER
jgi:hypothetical protein